MTAIVDRSGFRFVRAVAAVVFVAGLLLLALELALVPLVNRLLDRDARYSVTVDDVDLAPWRGAYVLKGVTVRQRDASPHDAPALTAARLEAGVDLRALTQGRIVGRIGLRGPTAQLAKDSDGRTALPAGLSRALRDLLPLSLNRIDVDDGRVRVVTDVEVPGGLLSLQLESLRLRIDNLENTARVAAHRFGAFDASAVIAGSGIVTARGDFAPAAATPSFSVHADVHSLPLSAFSFSRGRLDLSVDVDAKDGRFRGFARPTVTGLDSAPLRPDLGQRVVRNVVDAASDLLDEEDDADDDVNVFSAIVTALVQALSEALRPFAPTSQPGL